jgi:hypothetical protein
MRVLKMAGVTAGLILLAGGFARAQDAPTRHRMMETACAATTSDLCRAQSDDAVAKGQSVQLVILRGCQAEFKPAASLGAQAIDAAKDRVTECLELAVRGSKDLPAAELSTGQDTLRKRPALAGLSATALATSLRSRLSQTDSSCSRIKHKYTRYNCYTRRLHDLFASS